MPDWQPYAGRWVAVVAGRVAGSGRTPEEARRMALHNRPKDRPTIGFVRPGETNTIVTQLAFGPELELIRPLLVGGSPAYLVGGAVRDALLGRVSHDLDFAVDGDAVGLGRSIANALDGDFYLLDAKRGTARVLLSGLPGLEANETAVLDFARLRGNTLQDDLHDRDFSINAMALPAELATPTFEDVIDPLNGQSDLATGHIRATGPHAIQNDPIRGLRAVRQAAALHLEIVPETQNLIRAAADQLVSISAERIRDEFCRLLIGPQPARSLKLLDQLGLLSHVLPELTATRDVTQSAPHLLDVFAHSLLVVEKLEQILLSLDSPSPAGEPANLAQQSLAPFAAQLTDNLQRATSGDRNRRMILFLSTLLHDVGKPNTRTVEENGRIRFFNHEQVGAKLAGERGRALALSTAEVKQLYTTIQHHMRPAQLAKTAFPPSRRAIYRFFRDTKTYGLDVCLLCLADGLGKGGEPESVEWERRVETVAILLENYYNQYGSTIAPPSLLSGQELMDALDIPPGPEVGRLLRLIEEAQAAGEVSTITEALALARGGQPAKPHEPGSGLDH